MNEERLRQLLGSLRTERPDRIADDHIRAKLENAWSARRQQRPLGIRLRRLTPALVMLVLFASLGAATMTASGDSLLYGARIAIEDAAVAVHTDPEDRAEYLVALLEQRQDEAARLEATGNAAAAGKARQIEQDTLRVVRALLPQAPEVQPAPPAPTETPARLPAPTQSVAPSPSPAGTAAARPSTPRPTAPTPTPSRTDTPARTVAPTPTPTGSPIPVTIAGTVKNADGTLASGVCVLLQTGGSGCLATTTQGSYRLTVSARVNQTITLYFTRQDGTVLWKGTVSAVVKSGTVAMATVALFK